MYTGGTGQGRAAWVHYPALLYPGCATRVRAGAVTNRKNSSGLPGPESYCLDYPAQTTLPKVVTVLRGKTAGCESTESDEGVINQIAPGERRL